MITPLNTISFSTVCGGRYLEGGPSYVYSGGGIRVQGKAREIYNFRTAHLVAKGA